MNPCLCAQVVLETGQVLNSWRLDHTTREWIILFGATGLVALLALGWAKYLRKRHHRRHSHHHHHGHRHHQEPTEAQTALTGTNATAEPKRHHRRRRRSHHRHRRLNPTLAETGGLPPIRQEGASTPEP